MRADHTARILESRIIGLTEGTDMTQRRAMNDLASFNANEEKVFSTILELNKKKSNLEKENKLLDHSLIKIKGSNHQLINELNYLEGVAIKIEKEVEDLNSAIEKKSNNTKEMKHQLDTKYELIIQDENITIRDQDKKINGLEMSIRELFSQMEELKSKKNLLLETVKKNVCSTIYDVLVDNKQDA